MKNAYRDRVKRRLGILQDDLQFDSDIDDFTTESINSLYPIVQAELAPESFVLNANSSEIDLSESEIVSVRKLKFQDENGYLESSDEYTMHADVITIYGSSSYERTVVVEGSGRYDVANVPLEYNQVIINWIMSEFYSLLTGDKRKYNIYTQTTGARSVDNLRDLSDYYLDRGNQILADRATIRGQ